MYGIYDLPLKIERDGLQISVSWQNGLFHYERVCHDVKVSKTIKTDQGRLLVHPVEPLNTPEPITNYFLLQLSFPAVIEPKGKMKVYAKFPVEIGVFSLFNEKEASLMDIISLPVQKYTLYGNPSRGRICRWYQSELFTEIPSADPLLEGVMELNIRNDLPRWVEVHHMCFSAYGMKVYFNQEMVSLKATMEINTQTSAETEFHDSPIRPDMKKATEIFYLGMITLGEKRFVMEEGY